MQYEINLNNFGVSSAKKYIRKNGIRGTFSCFFRHITLFSDQDV